MQDVIAISTRLLDEEVWNVGTRIAPITKYRISPINAQCKMYHTMHTVPCLAHRSVKYMKMPFGHLNELSVACI